MDIRKAHALVDTIISTHADAVRVRNPDALAALQNARLDLHGLVGQIIAECAAEARGGFEQHADEAIDNTRET